MLMNLSGQLMFLVSSTVLLLGIFGVSELPKLNQLWSACLEATVCLKKTWLCCKRRTRRFRARKRSLPSDRQLKIKRCYLTTVFHVIQTRDRDDHTLLMSHTRTKVFQPIELENCVVITSRDIERR